MRAIPIVSLCAIMMMACAFPFATKAQDAPYDRAIVAQHNGDYDTAEALFLEGAQNSAYGKYWLARFYDDARKDYTQAAYWYEQAAEEGDNGARINLASLYERGLGVEQDYAKAHGLYKEAAEDESLWSVYKLATLYENGLGVRKNRGKARKLYKKAAAHGFIEAQERLAAMER